MKKWMVLMMPVLVFLLVGCAVQMEETKATSGPVLISGTVLSDTGEKILEAKIVVRWWERGEEKSKEFMSRGDGGFVGEAPKRPLELEVSKPDYFGAKIKPKTSDILTGLKFVLESGGKLNVKIIGLDKEELGSLRVKAIATGKEYHRSDKMYIPLKFDAARGVRQAPARDGVFCEISGIPTGPAEVHVSSNGEKLPVQTVAVKGGAVVNVIFEFKLNKVVLSGIVTQLGKPLSNWLLIFKRTDGKPIPGISGVITPSDGWYEIKLDPGTYEIQLGAPGVFTVEGVRVKGHAPKYIKTHNVTKSETLNLETSSFKKID